MAEPAQLEVVAGHAAGTTIAVDGELLIGRQATGPGQLLDEKLSRRHARVSIDGTGACTIEDLGSSNGTFVNQTRIAAPVTLAAGDTIVVGQTTLVVRSLPAPVPVAVLDDTPTPPRGTAVPPPTMDIDIDYTAGTADLWIAGATEPLRLVFEAGAWRVCTGRADVR